MSTNLGRTRFYRKAKYFYFLHFYNNNFFTKIINLERSLKIVIDKKINKKYPFSFKEFAAKVCPAREKLEIIIYAKEQFFSKV